MPRLVELNEGAELLCLQFTGETCSLSTKQARPACECSPATFIRMSFLSQKIRPSVRGEGGNLARHGAAAVQTRRTKLTREPPRVQI